MCPGCWPGHTLRLSGRGQRVPDPVVERCHRGKVASAAVDEGAGLADLHLGLSEKHREAVTAKEMPALVVGIEASRHSLARWLRDLISGDVKPEQHRLQLLPTSPDDRVTVGQELRRSEPAQPGPQDHAGRRDAHEKTWAVPSPPKTFPEPEIEPLLVRALVLREAHVVVDAKERPIDLWLRRHTWGDHPQARRNLTDERERRFDVVALIVLPVGVEPVPAVVRIDAGQEGPRLFAESPKPLHVPSHLVRRLQRVTIKRAQDRHEIVPTAFHLCTESGRTNAVPLADGAA